MYAIIEHEVIQVLCLSLAQNMSIAMLSIIEHLNLPHITTRPQEIKYMGGPLQLEAIETLLT